MSTLHFRNLSIIALIGLCSISNSTHARLLHWVDDKGNDHYADRVAPKHSKYKREILNNHGRIKEVLDAAKTKEQIEQDNLLRKLRKENEKLIAKQRNRDRVLLTTYHGEEDIYYALNNKLQAIDAQQKIAQGNLQRLENQLETMQKIAAEHERNGRKVPKSLRKNLKEMDKHINKIFLNITQKIRTKFRINKLYEEDIERFRYLTKKTEQVIGKSAKNLAQMHLPGVMVCTNEIECYMAWKLAYTYVRNYSTTGMQLKTNKLILANDAENNDDLSLSVSRLVSAKGKTQLFLDVRCKENSMGAELCASDRIHEMKTTFRPFIESGISVQK